MNEPLPPIGSRVTVRTGNENGTKRAYVIGRVTRHIADTFCEVEIGPLREYADYRRLEPRPQTAWYAREGMRRHE